MTAGQTSEFGLHLRRAMLLQNGVGRTDGQLLEDYLSRKDEAALAALVHRHAPMVWGVCRRVLPDYHDAEDAFQAAFLVFVRKAASIASRELLANWLYSVAYQTALKARATAGRRKGREKQVTAMPEPAAADQDQWHDLQPLLDEELSRLPAKYRAVFVLCDLEGKTRKEVARQLDCPEGTVAGRLSRARAMLAKQLARRGVVLTGGALAAVLAQHAASAGVPPSVVSSTIKAASLLADGRAAGVVSAKVAALAKGVVQAMFATRIKGVLAVVFVVGLVVAGTAGSIYRTRAAPKDAPKKAEEKPVPAETDRERMIGSWTVTNADGKRRGEPWVITKDRIQMHASRGGYSPGYLYALDASKTPRQIDLSLTPNGGTVIKGIYALDGDELRMCLALGVGKERPTEFAAKPGSAEFVVLRRINAKKEQKVLTPEEAIKLGSKEAVTVQFRVTAVEVFPNPGTGFGGPTYYIYLKDGGRFTARLARAADQLMGLDIDPVKHFNGKLVRVTGRVESDSGSGTYHIWVVDLTQIELVKD